MINIIISLDLSNRYPNKSRKISIQSYITKNYDIITSGGDTMCLIWNLIKAFEDTEDDNKKDNNDLEDWQKELVK